MSTTQFPGLLDEVNAATVSLRKSRDEVPPDVAALVDSLDMALHAEAPLNLAVDPYFASALYAGALRSMKALRHDNVSAQRRDLRVALEQVRHALRDIVGSHWVSDDVPIHEVLEHLVGMLRLPQSDVAHLLGISTRQLQRTLGCGMKTAWFLGHRIRHAMAPGSVGPLGGAGKTVEADEAELSPSRKTKRAAGHRRGDNARVLSLVERDGAIRSMSLDHRMVGPYAQTATNIAI